MLTLTLTDEEVLVLSNMLECAIDDLWGEIRETDRCQYKEMLRHRRDILRKVYRQIHTEEVPV